MTNAVTEQLKDYQEFHKVFESVRKEVYSRPIIAFIRVSLFHIYCNPLTCCQLFIVIDYTQYFDQFEWDITSEYEDPEQFASIACSELGLSPEFENAIAHGIREQTFWLRKALLSYEYHGLPEETIPIDLSGVIKPQLEDPAGGLKDFRDLKELENFTPKVRLLTQEELDKLEFSQDRHSRLEILLLLSNYLNFCQTLKEIVKIETLFGDLDVFVAAKADSDANHV